MQLAVPAAPPGTKLFIFTLTMDGPQVFNCTSDNPANCTTIRVLKGTSWTARIQIPDKTKSFQGWVNAPSPAPANPCAGSAWSGGIQVDCTFTASANAQFAIAPLGGKATVTVYRNPSVNSGGIVLVNDHKCGTYSGVTYNDCTTQVNVNASVSVEYRESPTAANQTPTVFGGWAQGAGTCTGIAMYCQFTASSDVTLEAAEPPELDYQAVIIDIQVKNDNRPNQITCYDPGYRLLDYDLNRGTSKGDVIKLCIRYGPESVAGKILDHVEWITVKDGTGDCASPGKKIPVDLNRGAGGDYLYLCTEVGNHAQTGIHGLRVVSTYGNADAHCNVAGAAASKYTMVLVDSASHYSGSADDWAELNDGAGGDHIRMCRY